MNTLGVNVLSLFDGMSCGQIALERVGIKVNKYFSSEIDKYAMTVATKNYPRTIHCGDVQKIKYKNGFLVNQQSTIFPVEIDLLIGGSPCQDLSGLKDGKGLEGDKSKLFFEFLRLKESANPKYFILENVVPRKREWKDQIDSLMGVDGIYINSDLFSPQNRPRIYWTNLPIGSLPQRPNWNETYYQYRRTYFRKNMSGVCPCLTANMGTGGHNVPLKSEDLKDKLTPEECEILQTLPSGYTSGVSNAQRYKMIGNGWTVDVISHILKGIALSDNESIETAVQQTLLFDKINKAI